jgi:ABC-2 type transport system permease protein
MTLHRSALASPVVPYLAVARQSFRRQSTYRLATTAGVFTNTVFGIVLAAVMLGLYRAREASGKPTIDGLDASGAVTLVFVGQAMLMVIAMFGWRDLTDRVRAGQVAADLQRPVDVSTYWGAYFVGSSTYFVLARGIPPFVVGALVFDMVVPAEPLRWIWFSLSVVGAAIVASRWWFLVSLSAFWVVGDVRGFLQLSSTTMLFFTGSLLPLQLLPDGLETVARWTPFATMLQFPGQVLLGTWSGPMLLLVQLAWAICLHLVGLAVFSRATRKVVIDGG